ncbi:MAG TPA: MoaD/ThiS family protein [Rhizomicrobium sp.]|jgi:sulfur carrier protein ThiS|nr:MoaD/ThiS family protein [Rhizomicrobium sp.]
MARISFTQHLRAVGPTDPASYDGATLADVLAAVARDFPRLPDYLLDDQGKLRRHIAIFIDGVMAPRDQALARPLATNSEIHIFQALSGG